MNKEFDKSFRRKNLYEYAYNPVLINHYAQIERPVPCSRLQQPPEPTTRLRNERNHSIPQIPYQGQWKVRISSGFHFFLCMRSIFKYIFSRVHFDLWYTHSTWMRFQSIILPQTQITQSKVSLESLIKRIQLRKQFQLKILFWQNRSKFASIIM